MPREGFGRIAAYHLHNPAAAAKAFKRNLADGTLLWQYSSLDSRLQRELARSIGTTPGTILQHLLQIDLSTTLLC